MALMARRMLIATPSTSCLGRAAFSARLAGDVLAGGRVAGAGSGRAVAASTFVARRSRARFDFIDCTGAVGPVVLYVAPGRAGEPAPTRTQCAVRHVALRAGHRRPARS